MADPAHEATDKEIERLRKRLHVQYSKAYKEMRARYEAAYADFQAEDAEWAKRVKSGDATERQHKRWREDKARDVEWMRHMVDTLSSQMSTCDQQAAAIVNGTSPGVFAENYNYGAYQVEGESHIDTAFTLVDADTVAQLVRDQPDLLPRIEPRPSKAERWARRKITSAITQSVIAGDGIERAASRLRSVVDMDERAAVRAARTALTGAENSGRLESYQRALGLGIGVRKQWLATLDGRTRDSHRQLDGESVDVGKRFSNGLRYPGDPTGPAAEVWNCRCTLVADVEGVDTSKLARPSDIVDADDPESYARWKAGRASGRSMSEFMGMPSVRRRVQGSGLTERQVRDRIRSRLEAEGRSFGGLSRREQRAELGRALAFKEQAEWRANVVARTVDMGRVRGKGYRSNVRRLFGEDMAEMVHGDIVRMLGHRSGTPYEDVYAYDLTSRTRIGSVVNQDVPHQARIGGALKDGIERATGDGHEVALVHNHPDSSLPSAADIATVSESGASFGVIAAHDGSLVKFSQVGEPAPGYNISDEDVAKLTRAYGGDDVGLPGAYETMLGVRVEHLA